MIKRDKKVIFNFRGDDSGVTLTTKLKGEINMEHIKIINKYTQRKISEYDHKVKEAIKLGKKK